MQIYFLQNFFNREPGEMHEQTKTFPRFRVFGVFRGQKTGFDGGFNGKKFFSVYDKMKIAKCSSVIQLNFSGCLAFKSFNVLSVLACKYIRS